MSRLVSPMRNAVVLTVLALVTVALFGYGSIVLASHQLKSEIDRRVQATAAVSAVVVGQKSADLTALVHSYASGRSLVGDVQGQPGDTPLEEILNHLTSALPGISASFVASLSGTSLATYPPEPSVIGTNFAYRNWYKGLVATGRPYVANAIVTKEVGSPLAVTYTDYIRSSDGTPIAILGINYSLNSLAVLGAEISQAQGITLTVADRTGTSLTTVSKHGLVSLADDPRVRGALARHSGVVEYSPTLPGGGHGPTELSAYTPVPGTGWAVIASIPNSLAFAGLNQLRATLLAITVALMFLLLVGVRIIVVFDRRRRQSDLQVQSRDHELARVLESTDEGFVSIDATGAITVWNAQAEKLFGWKAEEVMGRNLIDTVIPPGIRADYRVDIARFQPGSPSRFIGHRMETTALHRNGHEFPVEVSIWAHQASGGFSEFVHDISERVATASALEAARNEAMEASQLKSEFLANMSHEIRTPMNGVIGMSGLLLRTNLDIRQRDYAETVWSSAHSLMKVINDILDFSKIEAGKLDVEGVPFDLRSVVEESAVLLAATAQQIGLELTCAIDPDLPATVRGDPGRLRQVLLNLLGNAVKFTSQGEVNLTARVVGNEPQGAMVVELSVRDTGIGIPADALEHLFDAFTQAESSTSRRYGGTGLGLAISRQLVELMGGTLTATSQLGSGSAFTAMIPFGVEDPATTSGPVAGLLGRRVLVVDDNATSRRVLQDMMGPWGCDTTGAEGADRALDLLRDPVHPFDAVVLDLNMPRVDGYGLIRKMRDDPSVTDVPIIMLTSSDHRGSGERRRQAVVVAYLTKPVRAAQLRSALAEAFEPPADPPATSLVPASPAIPMSGPDGEATDPETDRRHKPRDIPDRDATVLLVEDNLVNQRVFTAMLRSLGYGVDVATNGLEALDAMDRVPYPVVFMDCQMPLMDGYQATLQLREREGSGRHTHVVAVTASAMDTDRIRCFDAGMDDYLTKPFNVEDLAAKMEQWERQELTSRHPA